MGRDVAQCKALGAILSPGMGVGVRGEAIWKWAGAGKRAHHLLAIKCFHFSESLVPHLQNLTILTMVLKIGMPSGQNRT